jgi:Family of unknown function (DUF6193)
MEDSLITLYPEFASGESLGSLLRSQHHFEPDVKIVGYEEHGWSPFWVDVSSAHRSSTVTVAIKERSFMVPFSQDGVGLARLSTESLDEVVSALDAWHARRCSIRELQRLAPRVTIRDGALEYELGPQAFVAHRWGTVRSRLDVQDPSLGRALDGDGASRLRALMPVWTMQGLAFSPCTGHPHIRGPVIGRARDGRYMVSFGDERSEGLDAVEAVGRAVDLLPSGFGPAQHGTATSVGGA